MNVNIPPTPPICMQERQNMHISFRERLMVPTSSGEPQPLPYIYIYIYIYTRNGIPIHLLCWIFAGWYTQGL